MLTLNLKFKILDFLEDGVTIRNFCQIFPELVEADYYWNQRYNDKLNYVNLIAYDFTELPGMVYTIFINELIRKQDQDHRFQSLRQAMKNCGLEYRGNWTNLQSYNQWIWRRPFFNELTVEQMAKYFLAEYWLIDYSNILTRDQLNQLKPIQRYQLIMEKIEEHPPPTVFAWSDPEYPDWLMNYDNPNY